MASTPTTTVSDAQRKRLNLLRYGMMVIPVVAWVVAFSYPFLLANAFGQDGIATALISSLVIAVVTGVICFAVYWAYKRFVLKI
ncbi:MAG: hypothetical protein HY741_19070 [Chloroflexi bacterium]|nr:hypothetical protein [Chloroflexota bacterium]